MSTKISALPPSAGLVLTDIFPVVDDPGGTPATQKATFAQLQTLLSTGGPFVLKAGDTMTGVLVHPVGAVGTPSITFTGDLDTGIYHPAADTVGISAGGTLVLSAIATGVNVTGALDVSTDLNVNVGITSLATGSAIFGPAMTASFYQQTTVFNGFDSNSDPFAYVTFDSGLAGASVGIAGYIGFFDKAVTPVTQQTAPGNTLAEVLAALRAYGLLAP